MKKKQTTRIMAIPPMRIIASRMRTPASTPTLMPPAIEETRWEEYEEEKGVWIIK